MATLATGVRWGTETPAIYFDVSYTASRSGANMVYTVNVDFQALSSNYGRYFGYPIYLDLSLDGVAKVTKTTVKNASPSNWSAGQVYYHSGSFSIAKTTGTTALSLKIYSGDGSSRSQTYSYSLPVSPAASVLTLPSGGFTIGSAGTISVTRYDTSFTDTITYSVGSASGTISTISSGSSTSVSWTPPTSLYAQMGGGTSKTGTITVTTTSGGTTVGTNAYTFTLNGYAPSTLTLPSGGFTVNTAGTISISRKSTAFADTITYTVGSATGTIRSIASGTSISSFTWTPPSSLYNQMIGQNSRTGTIKITTTSSGTTVGTTTYNFTLNAGTVYNRPVVTLTYERGDNVAFLVTTVKVTANIQVYGGQTATYTLKLDGTTKETASNLSSGSRVTYIQDVDTQTSHTITATLTDTLGNATAYSVSVSTEAVPMNINVDLPSVAFGKIAETANTLDTVWNIKTTGNIRGHYYDVFNTKVNGAQMRFRFSDADDAVAGNAFLAWANGGRFYFREHSADSNGNVLGNFEQFILPAVDSGRTSNATYNIVTDKHDATLTKTYSSNSYITSAGFNSVYVYRRGPLYIIRGNLYINSMPSGTTYTTVGTFSNYSAIYEAVLTVPAQNGSGVLLVTITTAGEFKIYNGSGVTINSYCRFNLVVPAA